MESRINKILSGISELSEEAAAMNVLVILLTP